jgi:hypothetical protein
MNTFSRTLPSLAFLISAFWGSAVSAAPPAAPPASAVERLERLERQPPRERSKAEIRQVKRAIRKGAKGRLHFLSESERVRLAKVEPIDVPNRKIPSSSAATTLKNVCKSDELESSLNAIADVLPVAKLDSATFQQELQGKGELASPPANASKSPTDALAYASRLVAVGQGIRDVCRSIDDDVLLPADVGALRASLLHDDFAFMSEVVTDVVNGKDEILALAQKQDLAATADFIAAVTAGEGTRGIPRGGIALASLGAGAQIAFEGLAEFLIDRAKEEALIFIRDQLVGEVCQSDIRIFVPETCSAIMGLDPSMAISAMGTVLHVAISSDLQVLPDRGLVLVWLRHAEVAYPATVVRAFLPLAHGVEDRRNPLEYVANLHVSSALDCEAEGTPTGGDDACANTMAVLRLASAATHVAVANSDAETDTRHFGVVTALELERRVNMMPRESRTRMSSWGTALTWRDNEVLELDPDDIRVLSALIMKGMDLHAAYEAYSKIPDPNHHEMLSLMLETAALSTETAHAAIAAVDPRGQNEALKTISRILEHAPRLLGVLEDIASEDRSRASLASLSLVTEIVTAHARDDTSDPAKSSQSLAVLHQYLALFVEIANAKSSADVNAALQAAFPVGGYKRKYLQGSFAINGFLGMYGGGTLSNSLDPTDQLDWGNLGGEFAMFAPVGIHVTGPLGAGKRRPWHLGGMVSVIDLGAITTSKWIEQEMNPEVPTFSGTNQLELGEPAPFNIAGLVSPGAYFTVGIAGSPVVFGLGASLNPFAQKRTSTQRDLGGDIASVDEKLLPALRFGVFLAVDITFVSFGIRKR